MRNRLAKLSGSTWAMGAMLVAIPFVAGSCGDLQGDETQDQGAVITSTSTITQVYGNGTGTHQTISTAALPANPSTQNAFFESIGTNGRRCDSCHEPSAAWTIRPSEVLNRFNSTSPKGMDPIFRTN